MLQPHGDRVLGGLQTAPLECESALICEGRQELAIGRPEAAFFSEQELDAPRPLLPPSAGPMPTRDIRFACRRTEEGVALVAQSCRLDQDGLVESNRVGDRVRLGKWQTRGPVVRRRWSLLRRSRSVTSVRPRPRRRETASAPTCRRPSSRRALATSRTVRAAESAALTASSRRVWAALRPESSSARWRSACSRASAAWSAKRRKSSRQHRRVGLRDCLGPLQDQETGWPVRGSRPGRESRPRQMSLGRRDLRQACVLQCLPQVRRVVEQESLAGWKQR